MNSILNEEFDHINLCGSKQAGKVHLGKFRIAKVDAELNVVNQFTFFIYEQGWIHVV